MRTGGGDWHDLHNPSTGSIPMRALKETVMVMEAFRKATAKAVLPPLLWPERANLDMSGLTFGGRTAARPFGSQFATSAVDVMSSVQFWHLITYSCQFVMDY